MQTRKQLSVYGLQGAKARWGEQTIEQRFWAKVSKTDSCWLWTGNRPRNRYGAFKLGTKKLISAHRFSWQIAFGPIPKGSEVCHKCDEPGCVNPQHLFIATHKQNMEDAAKKGRMKGSKIWLGVYGDKFPGTKYKKALKDEIRKAYSRYHTTCRALAQRYQIPYSAVRHIVYDKPHTLK